MPDRRPHTVHMSPTQSAAFLAFLATLTPAQRATFLDCVGSAVENAEYNDELEDAELEESLELEGHVLLVSLRDATIEAIQDPAAPWV